MANTNGTDAKVPSVQDMGVLHAIPYSVLYTDPNDTILAMNQVFKQTFSIDDSMLGKQFDLKILNCNNRGKVGPNRSFLEFKDGSDAVIMEKVTLTEEETVTGYLYTFRHQKLAEQEEKKISGLADRDYLTNLYNRRGLYNYYEHLEQGGVNHFLFLDLDNFKIVNDVYGHAVGDELLICVGKEIQKCLKGGVVSRIGGDEFVVVIPGTYSQEEVIEMAKAMLTSISQMDYRKEVVSTVSTSIGIILDQPRELSLDDILYKCDSAMYRAKESGKNQYVIFNAMEEEVNKKRSIEKEMHDALANGEFIPYLQPKFNMLTSQLYGAEALVRWKHPVDGIRQPMEFLPVLERSGFITEMDMSIYEQVCQIKQSWKGKPYEHLVVSVNMSRLHFFQKDFIEKLIEIAERYGVKTNELEIEVTEGIFFRDKETIIKRIIELKKAGFFIAIDDFGSGYSSLSILKDIPADSLKIDRNFLQMSDDSIKSKTVIRNIITMGKDLKMELMAEGVETLEQMMFLTSCGCELAQGFYYSKPLPVDEFEEYAARHLLLKEYRIKYSLDGTLCDETGQLEARYVGDQLEFAEGVVKGHQAVVFPGGDVSWNVLELPTKTLCSESYTISLWLKPTQPLEYWTSVLFMEFNNGFASLAPLAWEGASIYRVRDARRVNAWFDTPCCCPVPGEWVYITITYDSKSGIIRYYFNGKMAGILENVPSLRVVKRIYVGGDIFKKSFVGHLCELEFTNHAKSAQNIWQEFLSYVETDGFVPLLDDSIRSRFVTSNGLSVLEQIERD